MDRSLEKLVVIFKMVKLDVLTFYDVVIEILDL